MLRCNFLFKVVGSVLNRNTTIAAFPSRPILLQIKTVSSGIAMNFVMDEIPIGFTQLRRVARFKALPMHSNQGEERIAQALSTPALYLPGCRAPFAWTSMPRAQATTNGFNASFSTPPKSAGRLHRTLQTQVRKGC